ncbi:hypothetical protein ANTRET_LOCUS6888 [Anthophora retusa]
MAHTNTSHFCEEHFTSTITQDKEGRYTVAIPFKEGLEMLSNSIQHAEKRLLNLEHKLADIAKMYRQIWVREEDRKFQQILWRKNRNETIKAYSLNTKDTKQHDLLTGTDSISETIQLKTELDNILRFSGFELRKWASNETSMFSPQTVDPKQLQIVSDTASKTLGLFWNFDQDILTFSHLHSQWNTFRGELMHINSIKIPRYVLTADNKRIELHAFSDASERAYRTCVYLHTLDNQNRWSTHLLCAKSKVAPLKVISLPRLELCGAQLLAQLVKRVRASIDILCDEYYWCDSTIVLAWISSPSKQWKTFVANRVAEIQRLSQGKWSHVASSENPADIISRGISPSFLVNDNL